MGSNFTIVFSAAKATDTSSSDDSKRLVDAIVADVDPELSESVASYFRQTLDHIVQTLGGIEVACRSQEIILGLVASHRVGGARVSMPLSERTMSIRPDSH